MKVRPDRARDGLLMAAAFLVASFAAHRGSAAEPAKALPPPPPAPSAPELDPVEAANQAVPAVVEAPAAPGPASSPPVQSIHPLPFEDAPSRWYGWQTLAADGASIALSIASIGVAGSGSDTPSEALVWGAFGTYVLGAPIVHWVHENTGRGFASLGLRVGGPTVLAFIGVEAENCSHQGGDFCGFGGALIGATVGIVAAVTIDAAVFAYDDDRPETGAAAARFRLGVGPRGLVAFGSF